MFLSYYYKSGETISTTTAAPSQKRQAIQNHQVRTKAAFFWAPEKDYVARYKRHPSDDGYVVVIEDHGNGMERGVRIPIQPSGFVNLHESLITYVAVE